MKKGKLIEKKQQTTKKSKKKTYNWCYVKNKNKSWYNICHNTVNLKNTS